MNNFYFLIVEEIDGKRIAYVDSVADGQNIASRWEASNFEFVQPCKTRKQAESLAELWNESYKANGTYLYI